MFIEFLELEGYIPFASVEIETLAIEFTSPLQIFIGTNGCGKTSLLRRCNPLPPVRNREFRNGGKDVIRIHHEGEDYLLVSDFSTSAGAHKFWKGEETFWNDEQNLNVSGTTGVQTELVETHFGYTSFVNNLVYGKYKFCSMGKSGRRALLMETNPYNLAFILDYYKKVSSRAKAAKNVLTRLMERKVLLEGKLLDKDLIKGMTEEANDLREKIAYYIETRHKLVALQESQCCPSFKAESLVDLIDVINTSIDTYQQKHVMNFDGIYYTDAKSMVDKINELDRDRSAANAVIHITEQQLDTLSASIRELETFLFHMDEGAVDDDAEFKLKVLEAKIEGLRKVASHNPLSREDVKRAHNALVPLKSLLDRISEHETIISRGAIALKRRKFNYWSDKLDNLTSLRDGKQYELDNIKPLRLSLSDIPKENCAQNACPLFRHFSETTHRKDAHRERLVVEINALNARIGKIEGYITQQGYKLNTLTSLSHDLDSFGQMELNTPGLRQVLQSLDVMYTMKTNPYRIVELLHKTITASEASHELDDLEKELSEKVQEISKRKSVGVKEKEVVSKHLDEKKHEYDTLVQKLKSVQKREREYARLVRIHRNVVYWYDTFKGFLEKLNSVYDDERMVYRNEVYTIALSGLKSLQDAAIHRLGQIDSVLREQDTLKARFEEEIIKEIEHTEKEKAQWEALEKALIRIPHKYTVSFLNDIIATMNALISQVFSYPFKLIPLKLEDPVTYNFKVKNRGEIVEDVSLCSEAQVEITDLAFNIALRRKLKLTNYPIYLDEVGRSFDPTHKQKLLDLLKYLLDDNVVSQMFLINHHAAIHEGMMNGETLVLDASNVVVPMTYNEHVKINGV